MHISNTKAQNIYLIGPMGAGKTSVGKQLAKLSRKQFYDSDQEIEKRTGVTISWIFEIEKEAGFRKREEYVIAQLTQHTGIVLSTGGGSIINSKNRFNLKTHGIVVYLRVPLQEQLQRTNRRKSGRPLLANNPRDMLIKLNKERAPLYSEIADLTYDTELTNPAALAKRIIKDIKGLLITR